MAPPYSSSGGARAFSVHFLHVVHVSEDPFDGNVADGVLEEESLHRGRADGSQARQKQQESAEARGLAWMLVTDVVPQNTLGLVLKHLDGMHVAEADRFCATEEKTRM